MGDRAKPCAALTRELQAAEKRWLDAAPGEAAMAAFKDYQAAQRLLRAARRADGEPLIAEDQRDAPVTMGHLEDCLRILGARVGKLERGKR